MTDTNYISVHICIAWINQNKILEFDKNQVSFLVGHFENKFYRNINVWQLTFLKSFITLVAS